MLRVEGNGEGKEIQGKHEERSTVKNLPLRHRLALIEYHVPNSTHISLHIYIALLVLKESFDVSTVVFTLKIK